MSGLITGINPWTNPDSAIQKDVAGEFTSLTEKSTLAAADLSIVEDSAASGAKKKVQQGNNIAGVLKSATTLVSVSAAPAPTSGQVLTATSSTAATWQAASGGGAWYSTRPTYMGAASAYDDEFTADTSANWTFNPTVSGSAIDPYATITTNPRVSWAGIRSSHLSLQLADNAACAVARAITLDTNAWLWARATAPSPAARTSGSSTDRTEFRAILCENATLTGHYLYVSIGSGHDSVSGFNARTVKNDTGGGPSLVGTAMPLDPAETLNQTFVQKVSGTYYFYAGTDAGNWYYLGSHAYSGNTLDNLIVWGFDDGTSPGSAIIQIDFVRYGSGIVALP